eukprot:4867059-Pyramimonas_sp.AAC.1
MLMSREAMVHCFLRAAVLASRLWPGRRAVPEKASASKASRSTGPRSAERNVMVRSISPFSLFKNFNLHA